MRPPRTGFIGSFSLFRSLVVALQFLTLFPVRARGPLAPGELGRSLIFFPVIGAVIGGIMALVGSTLATIAPPLLTAAIIVALGLALTGVLHFDGLLDTVDGLFGGVHIEDRLAIMRDSRVGSFALAAGICDVLFRLVTVNILVDTGALGGLLMAATGSRCAMVYAVVAFKPARDSGFSSDFRVGTNALTVVLAALIALVVGYAAVGPASLVLMACAFTLTHFAGMLAVSKVGGLTGDVYGAVNEIVEVGILIALALWWPSVSGLLG